MHTKKEIINFLDYLRNANETDSLVTSEPEKSVSYRRNLKIICESNSSEEAYKTIGSQKNVTIDDDTDYIPFEDIYFREDCYDYLMANSLNNEESERLMHLIRTGRYSFEKNQILKDKLSPDFFNWAVETTFLSSRIHFIEVFYMEYEKYKFTNKYEMPKIGKTFDEAEEVITRYSTTPETLYTDRIIKGKSSMLDEKGNQVVVTDYLAKRLLETKLLDNIRPVEMPVDKKYIVESHNGEVTTENESSNRIEEREAIKLFNCYNIRRLFPSFFADYQTPICRSSEVKADKSKHIGKIDLTYVSKTEEMIYLMEFKRYDNEESLLRCVTEIYTYYKQIDKLKLSYEISEKFGIDFIGNYKVVPAVLVYEGQLQHKQFRSSLFANVQKLMKKLGVKFFVIRSDKPYGKEGFFEAKNGFRIYELPVFIMNHIIKNNNSSLQEELDKAIMKADLNTEPEVTAGYIIGDRTFENYLSNDSFRKLISDMPENTRYMYGEGAGSELKERKNKHGVIAYPPKMASFGSSSKMIYKLANNITDFEFEKQTPTTVGGIANLDGYLDRGDKYVFIEAKCREPYGKKSKVIGTKYEPLYRYLNQSEDTEINSDMTDFDYEKETMNVTFSWRDDIIEHFDLKQMISHLLGIATAILKNNEYTDKSIRFLYLIYNPETLAFDNEETKSKILNIYYQTCNEAEATINKELFKAILLYLKDEYYPDSSADIDRIANNFSFGICNQENFIKKLTERI